VWISCRDSSAGGAGVPQSAGTALTEAEARAALRAFVGIGHVEPWIAGRPWKATASGWTVAGELRREPATAHQRCPGPRPRRTRPTGAGNAPCSRESRRVPGEWRKRGRRGCRRCRRCRGPTSTPSEAGDRGDRKNAVGCSPRSTAPNKPHRLVEYEGRTMQLRYGAHWS